jgi:CHAP domain
MNATTPTMLRSPIAVAITQLGVQEATGKNDGAPAERYNHGQQLPWCAAFVLWCFEQAGAPIHHSDRDLWLFRSVARMLEALEGRGQCLGARICPDPNDLIFRTREGGLHVGIVERTTSEGIIYTVEGNLGDAVRRAEYATQDARIIGYARPGGGW